MKDQRCPICDGTKWENLDHLRLKKHDMQMCKECGFVSYKFDKTEEELLEFYRKSYRPAPQAPNLFTGERKLQYHAHVLGPIFETWAKAEKEKPVIGEIGAAYGMLLNWVKGIFPEADLCGTELTETFRRVAFHEYGIRLQEDLDYSKKYDLLMSYHVLEHQMDPDQKLAKYAACLKDDGLFYLSAPIWFREASNGAGGGFDLEYYWHKDHINCWSEEHLDYLIEKAGLEVVMKDTAIYGNTYLLKKSNGKTIMKKSFDKQKYYKAAENIKKIWEMLEENRVAEAIDTYPNCPRAWVNFYELNRAKMDKDKEGIERFCKDFIEACPNSSDAYHFCGELMGRYERYDESISYLKKALERKPNNPTFLMGIATALHMKGKKTKDVECFKQALNIRRFVMSISTESTSQGITWAYQDSAQIPIDA